MNSPRLESDLFDTIAGLPLHPLVVHVAVVVLPLAAIALVVIVLVPRWRGTFGWITITGVAIGTGAAFVAKESGEALAERVGEPQRHASLGDVLPLVAALLLVVALTWFLLDRRERSRVSRTSESRGRSPLVTFLGIVASVIAIGTIGLTIAVGHSGAEAVWAGRISDGGTTAPVPAPTAATSYTMADVAAHATPSDCWTVVDGTVYDVTAWIDRHPGGAELIEAMCGIDATAAFTGEHGGQPRPMAELESFRIGRLAGPAGT